MVIPTTEQNIRQCQRNKCSAVLSSMGVALDIMNRAFEIHRRIYGDRFNVERLMDIIIELQKNGPIAIATKAKNKNNDTDTVINPWQEIMNSGLKSIPQWVLCNSCEKWRILQIPTNQIISWRESETWTCSSNKNRSPNTNPCDAPQIIPKYPEYTKLQLKALTIQRKQMLKTAASRDNARKRTNMDMDKDKDEEMKSDLEPPRKKQRLSMDDHDSRSDLNREQRTEIKETMSNTSTYSKCTGSNTKLIKENKRLKEENNKLKEKLNAMHFDMDKIDILDEEELNDLEIKLQTKYQNELKMIREARAS